MQTVHLVGEIEKFGSRWDVNCTNIRDIFKLIGCQTPGFRDYLIGAAEANVDFEIQRGADFLSMSDELLLSLREEDIIIAEVPSGSKGKEGKVFAAITIVALMFATGGTAGPNATTAGWAFDAAGSLTFRGLIAANIATNLALSGLSEILAPGPETDDVTANDSYLFNGPVTTTPQGYPVPVVYGQMIVGGRPISVSYRHHSPYSNKTSSFDDAYFSSTFGTPLSGEDITATERAGQSGGFVPPSTAVGDNSGAWGKWREADLDFFIDQMWTDYADSSVIIDNWDAGFAQMGGDWIITYD